VWIIAGPIFNNKTPTQFLGEAAKNEMLIGIPDALFKIVIKESDVPPRPDVLAFIYPQEDTGHKKGPFNHIKFLKSIDDIEDVTGLDFLTILPEEDQDAIEPSKATELWN
jgi:endonuclease G